MIFDRPDTARRPSIDRASHARALALVCVQDAIERSGLDLVAEDHAAVDGAFVVLRDTAGRGLCLIDALPPEASPYDEFTRDRVRTVASRLQMPSFAIMTFRRIVVYATDAVARRMAEEQQIRSITTLADVVDLDDVRLARHADTTTTALRAVLRRLADDDGGVMPAEDLLAERLRETTAELLACTDGSAAQRTAVVRLATSVLAYGLLQMRDEETLERLRIPYGMRSARLMLDIVGAFFRDARAHGHSLFPMDVDDVHVVASRAGIFRSALGDLCSFLQRFDPIRLDDLALHRAVDTFLHWCSGTRHEASPVIDLVDVALRLAAPTTAGPYTLLEHGAGGGIFGVRSMILADSRGGAMPRVSVYVPTADDERHVLLRTIGHQDEAAGVERLRNHRLGTTPWHVVCLAASDTTERHRLRLLASALPVADGGAVVLVLPLAALHDGRWTGMRTALATHYRIDWILTSDVQSFAHHETALCCIVARRTDDRSEPARVVMLRQRFDSFFEPCDIPRERDARRVQGIDTFIRYLAASERGKNNAEAVVRVLPQQRCSDLAAAPGGWFDAVIPPDLLTRILQKASGRLQLLRDIATVHSGIRTGANDFFIVDRQRIADAGIEPQFWQRTLMSGNVVDNVVIADADDLRSISGAPQTDRRLLLVEADRRRIAGTTMASLIDQAERDGLHARPSVRQRDPWYALGDPVVPDLVIPKRQEHRRIIAINTVQGFVGDGCIGVTLHDTRLTEALALWMNSTVGLFFNELFRSRHAVADVTVRDAETFPVPTIALLRDVVPSRHRDFLRRPLGTIVDEWGTDDADTVRPDGGRRDRRTVDQYFMENVLGLSAEEQRWMLRLLLLWWHDHGNVRQIVATLLQEIEERHRLAPLSQWYGPLLRDIDETAKRTILVDEATTAARVTRTMFSWQVALLRGGKAGDVIDCASHEEAEVVRLLVELGKRHLEVPIAPDRIAEVLPRLDIFRATLDTALDAVSGILPDSDLRPMVRDTLHQRMTML